MTAMYVYGATPKWVHYNVHISNCDALCMKVGWVLILKISFIVYGNHSSSTYTSDWCAQTTQIHTGCYACLSCYQFYILNKYHSPLRYWTKFYWCLWNPYFGHIKKYKNSHLTWYFFIKEFCFVSLQCLNLVKLDMLIVFMKPEYFFAIHVMHWHSEIQQVAQIHSQGR